MQLYPLRIIPKTVDIDFMKIKNMSYLTSIVLVGLSLLLLLFKGLNLGIDFTGGIVIEARAEEDIRLAEFRKYLAQMDLGEASIQTINNSNEFIVRISGQKQEVALFTEKVKNSLKAFFKDKIEFRKVDVVGPQVGSQLVISSVQALVISFIAIMIYIWARFEWQFGIGILITLINDILVALGFMSITSLDFNLSSIAALLTIVGYSVNDSVVIYDRIRENLKKYHKTSIDKIINISINSTLSRTILTILTTLIANAALIFFGGEALRSFSLLMFFGIVAGTYSSIYVSAPLLGVLGLKHDSAK